MNFILTQFLNSDFSDEDITNTDSSDESIAEHESKIINQDRILKKKLSNFLGKIFFFNKNCFNINFFKVILVILD